MNDKFPSDKQDKFMLRLPDGMRDKIAQDAKAAGRSMNAEIVKRLEDSFVLGAQASADRIMSIVMVGAMGHGAKVEPEAVQRFIQGMIRTTQDADKLREIAGALKEAGAFVEQQKKTGEKIADAPPAHKKPRVKRG